MVFSMQKLYIFFIAVIAVFVIFLLGDNISVKAAPQIDGDSDRVILKFRPLVPRIYRDSIVRKIIKGTQRISFELNTVPKPRIIRLDPIDCSACIKIEHLIIHETGDSTSLVTDNLSSNAVHRSGNVFMFSDTDPQITIPVPRNVNTIHSLELELTVLSVGNQSLREIIDYQKNHYNYPVAIHKSVAGWLRKNITGQR